MENNMKQHTMNMCKFVLIAGDAVQAFGDIKQCLEDMENTERRSHVTEAMNLNYRNQLVRSSLDVLESIIGVSVEDTYNAVNTAEHGEVISSSSAHIGYQISQCKRYLASDPDIELPTLLYEIHYTLGNILFTAIEMFSIMTKHNFNNVEYMDTLGETSIDMSLEEIYNKALETGKTYMTYDDIMKKIKDEADSFDSLVNPYEQFGVEFTAYHNIVLTDDSGSASDDGSVSAAMFDEVDDDMFVE